MTSTWRSMTRQPALVQSVLFQFQKLKRCMSNEAMEEQSREAKLSFDDRRDSTTDKVYSLDGDV